MAPTSGRTDTRTHGHLSRPTAHFQAGAFRGYLSSDPGSGSFRDPGAIYDRLPATKCLPFLYPYRSTSCLFVALCVPIKGHCCAYKSNRAALLTRHTFALIHTDVIILVYIIDISINIHIFYKQRNSPIFHLFSGIVNFLDGKIIRERQ
jgi:hypothetical protein